jgi:hypothetical protein
MIATRATQGVSFPRSGHAIAYHLGRRYFGDAFVYCDANGTRFCGCGQVPCSNPARVFAKNHDFGLRRSPGVPVLENERYLVQYRNPVHSICSHYQLYLRNHPDEHTVPGWRKFALRDIFYWNHFIDKWVLDYPGTAIAPLYCVYEELMSRPRDVAREILSFMSALPLEESRFEQVLASLEIVPRNSLEEFQFYDPGFFDELERRAEQRLAGLQLPAWRDA